MMRKSLGGGFPETKSKPDEADPRHKLKAAELLLEDFKKKLEDEKFKPDLLKWTDEQVAQWIKDQEAAIAALRKQAEKGDWRTDRDARSPLKTGGPSQIKLDAKDSKDLLQSGKPPAAGGLRGPVQPLHQRRRRSRSGSTSQPYVSVRARTRLRNTWSLETSIVHGEQTKATAAWQQAGPLS